MNSETKTCQNCKGKFVIEQEDFNFYQKMNVPPPTFCPECRLQRRLAFRNERALYKRQCNLCGESFIGQYPADTLFPVYCAPCWWSDKWDATKYGQDYDFSKPFFEQFFKLQNKVPHMGTFTSSHSTMVNSQYTNLVGNLKNCYLVFNADYNEGCSYGTEIESSKDCFDNLMINNCELCYECVNCYKCYQTFFSIDCESCHNVWFSRNCTGCSDCFGCTNLRGKKFHFFNQPLSENEYKNRIKDIKLGAPLIQKYLEQRNAESLKFPFRYTHTLRNKNASGDYIYNSKNVRDSYIVNYGENCRFAMWGVVPTVKDVYDWTEWGNKVELAYECMGTGENARNCRFTRQSLNGVNDLEYCFYCISSTNLFGCISVKKNEFCILNKKYTKEEFNILREKIIKHMQEMPYVDKKGRKYSYGEFFPIEHSQFAYNETNAQELFPLTKEMISLAGYHWREPEKKEYKPTISLEDILEIEILPDSIANEILLCEHNGFCDHRCTKAFRVIPREIEFYRQNRLSLPIFCPNCRHYARLKQRNPFKLLHRKCQCNGTKSTDGAYINTVSHIHGQSPCLNEFETPYSFNRLEIVYCEKCYQQEVY